MAKPAIATSSKLDQLKTATKLRSVMLCGEAVNYAGVSNANDEETYTLLTARDKLERAAIEYVAALEAERNEFMGRLR